MSASNNAPGARRCFDARSMRSAGDVSAGRSTTSSLISPSPLDSGCLDTSIRTCQRLRSASRTSRETRKLPPEPSTRISSEQLSTSKQRSSSASSCPTTRAEHAAEFLTHLFGKISAREFRSNFQYLLARLTVQLIDYLGIHPPETFRGQIRPGRHSAKTLGNTVQRVDQRGQIRLPRIARAHEHRQRPQIHRSFDNRAEILNPDSNVRLRHVTSRCSRPCSIAVTGRHRHACDFSNALSCSPLSGRHRSTVR